MDNEPNTSRRPAQALVLIFLALGIFMLPPVLGRLISLDWVLGNITQGAWLLAAGFLALAALCWWGSGPINRRFQKTFPTNREVLFAAISIGVSCVVALVMAEVASRVLQIPFSGDWIPSENALAKFDENLGWSYRANHSASQEFGTDARLVEMKFDERGIRVADPKTPLNPSVPSALFVGGSFTMGHGLAFEDSFIGQLGAMPGFPFQVVNLGVQGFGTDQSLLQLKRHIETFDTKVVVYTFIYDHVRRNANHDRRIMIPQGRFLGTKPTFGVGSDGRPVLNKKPERFEDISFIRVLGSAERAWVNWGPKPLPDVTRALVQEMKKVAESHGAQLIVIDWNQDAPGFVQPSILDDLPLHLVDTRTNPPEGWHTWIIPGDTHPDKQASARVAPLVFEKIKALGLIDDAVQ